jgi:hypothetical protein
VDRLATTVGRGPCYLHLTGQLHKGGPNTVLALLITADEPADQPADELLPGEQYSFATFIRAQP